MKQYRIHGQIDYGLNKKPKSTYLSEIIDHAKTGHGKRPSPDQYTPDKAYDYSTSALKNRFAWNKEKRTGMIDVI